ncbi:hypothetical protein Cgig2_014566 [Carnegiea gigantea]|uniref:RHOMBOID-like protein n=1 Tax=Carnegiea gigantea TaxID=171969 RepID=A0A9Q1QRL5_9CARY|nr:hypothetical protein Cgig2_014566 [Carnegiea gigantea]
MAYYYGHPPGQVPMPMPMPMPVPMPMAAPMHPPMYMPPPQHRYTVWFMPVIFFLKIGMFIYSMYENNCPGNRGVVKRHDCILEHPLGRFSFEPYHENRMIGPATATLIKLGALKADLVYNGDYYRLFGYMFLHAGVIPLLINMLGVLIFGNRFETDFGFWRVGPLYLISGVGGSLMSVLELIDKKRTHDTISVGASGALFGLLGASLSELMTNWGHYTDRCLQLFSILLVIGLNVAIGLLNPWIDWAAHVGGFVTGCLLGFVLFIKPQPGYINRKYLPPGYQPISRHKCYQYIFLVLALVAFLAL